ncbi:hypothetical protein M758_7G114700 [Ceratodon purpureus]|nr:hypothetical protein M758_7G114700 [Ceratodon purpureus]
MLSKKKKGVPPLNPLKPEKWFAYYKERFGHHSGDRGNNLETSGVEGVADKSLKGGSKEEGKQQLNAERRKLLTAIRGSQYWATCDMKGDDSNSNVLPVAYKRPTSASKVSDPDQGQYSSKSAGNRKVEFFPRNLVPLRSQLQDPQRQREPDIQSTRPTSTSLLSDASSFRSPTSTNVSSKLAATQHGVVPTLRRSGAVALLPSRYNSNVAMVAGTDQSLPVREEGCAGASLLAVENGKIGRDPGGRMNVPVTSHAQVKVSKTKPHELIYGGNAMARPSCSEESSSDASDFSVDDAQSKVRHVSMADIVHDIGHGVQARDYGSSCSSSGSMSPLSLQSRFLDMRLQQNDVSQFRRDHQHSEYSRNAAPALKRCSSVDQHIGVQAGLVGLYNDGNTCYLNSCLQCLAHTLPLASAVLGPYSDQIQKKGGGSRHGVPEREWASPADVLTYAFHHIVRDLWGKPPYSVASANIFLQCVQAFAPQFAGSFQHDAQEVLRAILDGLHEALNRVKVATPYRDLYVELKPEVELADLTWKYHKSCHDSIIQGIFCGIFNPSSNTRLTVAEHY